MEPPDGIFGRFDIINNICNIAVCIGFNQWIKNILQGSLCAFDLGGHKCFFPYIHGDKQIDIRNACCYTFQDG